MPRRDGLSAAVRLQWAEVDIGRPPKTEDLELLSRDEIERADRFRVDRPRRVFVASRAALRRTLGRELECDPRAIVFSIGCHGKPRIAPDCDLHFNLSHSGSTIALGIAHGVEIGVDIEEVTRSVAFEDLADRFFAVSEAAAVRSSCPHARRRLFFHFWTAKEAVLKATGSGLSVPVRNVEIGPDPDATPGMLSFGGDRTEARLWHLHREEHEGRWMVTLAYRGERRPLVVEEIRRP